MFQKPLNWIKNNKFTALLLVIVLYFLFKNSASFQTLQNRSGIGIYSINPSLEYGGSDSLGGVGSALQKSSPSNYYPNQVPPQPDVTDRKVITNSNLSLLVKDVSNTVEQIKQKTKELKGYVVYVYVYKPEFGANGNITIRVPSDELDNTLAFLRGLSVKVVSENISGNDITDQYIDIQSRLARLESTKATFEEMLDRANTVDDILKIQQNIFSTQDQIDMYKGKLAYMDGASSTTLLTINLSTDELGLPYAPSQPWRPETIFKQAVRSLLTTLQKAGTTLIWLGVYSILIIPAATIVLIIYVTLKRRNRQAIK